MKNKKPLMIVTIIFAVIGVISTVYFGFIHVFNFIIAPRIGLDEEDEDCDCCDDDISNDDFFEDEGYYED